MICLIPEPGAVPAEDEIGIGHLAGKSFRQMAVFTNISCIFRFGSLQ
jgi:hypothetical protein